jgi:putative glutamine amidotransferase
MANAPRIGIPTYGRDADDWFRIPAQYVDAVRRAGGLPILLAPGETRLDQWLGGVDAVVLTGGGDLDPALYGGAAHAEIQSVDAERDAMELELVRALLARRIPTLAICRGMQMLNVVLGGTLIEHLPDVVGTEVLHRAPPRVPIRHPVSVAPGSKLAQILGTTEVQAMSWHHQALRRIADGLAVTAHAADGTVEAVELAAHPWLVAVQWHPELTAAEDPLHQRLFDALVRQHRSA